MNESGYLKLLVISVYYYRIVSDLMLIFCGTPTNSN